MQVRKTIYTLGDFKGLLARQIAEQRIGKLNIQSAEALELLNEVLPRNMMVKKLFPESEQGVSVMDTKQIPDHLPP